MLKWCIVRDAISRCAFLEIEEAFDSMEEALETAELRWNQLAKVDQKHTDAYTVCLCNVEQAENGEWLFAELENGDVDMDYYDIAKEFVER